MKKTKSKSKRSTHLTEERIAQLRTTPGRYRDERNLVLQVLSPTNASWQNLQEE